AAGTLAYLKFADANFTRSGLYTGNGGAPAFIADSSGPFGHFHEEYKINAEGKIAFSAYVKSTGGGGIFTGGDPIADKVIATGDPLFGSTVGPQDGHLRLYGLNDQGQIAFGYLMSDGVTKGIGI